MPPYEPIIITDNIRRFSGFRRPDGMCVWFTSSQIAMRRLTDGFSSVIWTIPRITGSWQILPLTRIN